MKTITKLTFALLMGFFAIGFQSCGSDDKDEPEIKIQVTQSEIQGNWECFMQNRLFKFTFTGNRYAYYRINNKNDIYQEKGSYTLNGTSITFSPNSGDSQIGGGSCEIYWENKEKTVLRIFPMGAYVRAE